MDSAVRRGLVLVIALVLAPAAHVAADRTVGFNRHIRPILAENCLECHGPDRAQRRADLRLDEEAARETDLGGYRAIVPGDPARSALISRIESDDPEQRMPPPESGHQLDADEIDLLRRWIEQGAEYEPHWAFITPERPEPPEAGDASWVRNSIDRFVLARLDAEGLEPAPEASRETLVRRLALDLTGLPPEPEVVDRFLADSSPDAYERLVEQLLASPHYGERWAIPWLDLARYGDTDGYDYDRPRDAWLYRDWVIDAINRDMPFDRFAVEQLAGDLLDDATDRQRIATGFIRNSAVPQYRFDMIVDRVSTTATAFLGLSAQCAQCHDHKYDPISQEEFYQLFAIFNNDEDEEIEAASPISGELARTLVALERDEPRTTHLAVGGSFLNEGDRVEPGAPRSLHELPDGGVPDRLALARWLVDPANPLIARVTVNRYWEAIFGQGLVLSSEDLGVRADLPSHPDLLDWLAVEFMERGWSRKHLHRLIVTSATYRQSARADPSLRIRDPNNRLLGRGPRFRVDAELVRDIALATSGLLDPRVGGPSVFPPQPAGITENRFRGAYDWQESRGADRYRRGLYTYWKRAALHPALELFDAPRRETTCSRRMRSNNPLQALVMLNEPAMVEAAILLGRRMWRHEAADPAGRIAHGFRLCTAREPDEAELAALVDFHQAELDRFEADPSAAEALLGSAPAAAAHVAEGEAPADWAAYAMVANVLLSLDETITKP